MERGIEPVKPTPGSLLRGATVRKAHATHRGKMVQFFELCEVADYLRERATILERALLLSGKSK